MSTTTNSYSYANLRRDLAGAMAIIMANSPSLLSIIPMSTRQATQNKFEWPELVMAAESDTLTAAITNVATTVPVTTGSAFKAGMIIAFEGNDEVMKVTAVAANNLTVTRGYGSTTAVAMNSGTMVRIIDKPENEASDPGDDNGSLPGSAFNFTQIFSHTAKVSTNAINGMIHGVDNMLDFQVENSLQIIARRMNNSIIYGRGVARSTTEAGTMSGLLQMVTNVSNAAAAALTGDILNNAIETVVKNGGSPNAIVCNTNQARKISALNNNKIQISRQDTQTGQAIYEFVNDLPMGKIQRIVVEPNMDARKLLIVDTTKLALVPFNGKSVNDVDATPNGADYVARRVLGEYTLQVMNAGQAHAEIINLAP
jgi:hypothetical protein